MVDLPAMGSNPDEPRIGFVFRENYKERFGTVVDVKPSGYYGLRDERGILRISVDNGDGLDYTIWARASDWRMV